MHFYAWEKGLKTGHFKFLFLLRNIKGLLKYLGMYYLRSRPAADPIKFTLDVESLLREAGSIDINGKRKLENTQEGEEGEEEGDENPEGLKEDGVKKMKTEEK